MAAVRPPDQQMHQPQQPSAGRRPNAGATIEDQVRAAYYVPAPQTYSPPNTHSQRMSEPQPLGIISTSQHPSALDWVTKNKAFVPGPGSYDTPDTKGFPLPDGGRVSTKAPVVREKVFDEYPRPDAATYGVPADPSRPRQINGQFSKEPRVSKFIQDEVVRTRSIPGPGTHEVQDAMEAANPFCPEGGRCLMQSKSRSYFDLATKATKDNPDPGTYQLPSSVNAHKATGQVCYRYESATGTETRELVHRLATDENPAPGTYDLPALPQLAQPPSIKGRSIPAMPHPYAYNCRPDYAGKFTQSVSVLHQNSADQIFGNGVNRAAVGASKSSSIKGSRPSSGDALKEKEVPVGLLAVEQPEAEIEWKAGGFAVLKKSKSAPAPQPEHPSVLEASKCYPKLQQKHRDNSAFLPWACRRTESCPTHNSSSEIAGLRCGKWQLGALVAGINKATGMALEPLNEDRLKREAMAVLRNKAKARMRLEGVSKSQQQIMMKEINGIMKARLKPERWEPKAEPSRTKYESAPEEALPPEAA